MQSKMTSRVDDGSRIIAARDITSNCNADIIDLWKSSDRQAQQHIDKASDGLPELVVVERTANQPAENGDSSMVSNVLNKLNDVADGVHNIAKDVVTGAIDEVRHHPLELAKNVAMGVAVGAAFALAGPEIALIAGTALALNELSKNGGPVVAVQNIWSDAKGLASSAAVDFDPAGHSEQQRAQAKASMEALGGTFTKVAAGMAGGIAGGAAGKLAGAALQQGAEQAVVAAASNPVVGKTVIAQTEHGAELTTAGVKKAANVVGMARTYETTRAETALRGLTKTTDRGEHNDGESKI